MDPFRHEWTATWHRSILSHQTHQQQTIQSTIEFGVLQNGALFARAVLSPEQMDQLPDLIPTTPYEQWLSRHLDWFSLRDDSYQTAIPLSVARAHLPKVRLSYPFGISEAMVKWLESLIAEYVFAQQLWILPDGKRARAMITYYVEGWAIEACKEAYVNGCEDWDQEGLRVVLFAENEHERCFEVFL